MRRVEKHIVRKSDKKFWKQLNDLCLLSKNLYNYGNYKIRQVFFITRDLSEGKEISDERRLFLEAINNEVDVYNKKRAIEFDKKQTSGENENKEFKPLKHFSATNKWMRAFYLIHLCHPGIDFQSLPLQTSQHILKLLDKNWTSFFESIATYKKHPGLFKGRPNLPKYKHKTDGRNIVIFSNQQARLKDGMIYFNKKCGLAPIKTRVTNLQQVRIVPGFSHFTIEVVYNYEPNLAEVDDRRMMFIDLGIDNLMACIDWHRGHCFLVNGRPLKAINQYFNKKKAELMSYVGARGSSNRIQSLTFKRNMKVDNYIHQATAMIKKYCIEHKIGVVILGYSEGWKQDVNIGKRNNQAFVNIPFLKIKRQLQYKLEEVGIKVIITEESYTSKVDHLALEKMEHHKSYSGSRIKRGWFKGSIRYFMNADIQGAIGIGRKVVGDELITSLLDRGVGFTPVKLEVPN